MKIINKTLFCLMVSLSVTFAWSSDNSDNIGLKVEEKEKNFGNLNILPEIIMKKIMQYQGVAKTLGTVCKDFEKLRCEKEILLRCKVKSKEDFEKISSFKFFKPSGIYFNYIPDNETLIKASKFSNLSYLKIKKSNWVTKGVKPKKNKLTDLSMFEGIHTLDLSFNKGLNDVRMPKNVHTLDLQWSDIEDVSKLEGVHELILTQTNVEDVSMLGGVHTLCLVNANVKDVSALGGVDTLRITTDKVKGFEKLATVRKLWIFDKHYRPK